MLVIYHSPKHVYIVCGNTDLRKGIDTLAILIADNVGMNLYNDSIFLFCGRRNDRFKALYWDGEGFIILYKRFENGNLNWPNTSEEVKVLSIINASIFGKKTEKLDKNQLSFFSEAELEELDIDSDISSKENEVELRVVRHRKVKPRGQRAEFLDTLVQVDVVHDLEQKNYADCHEKLTLIGKKCVYREVGLKQPELFCRNHYQQTYKCEN